MKKMEMSDGDVYNIDVFQILLKYEISRSKRYSSPLTLIQIKMTPTAASPEALKEASLIFPSILSARLRSADIPARAGNLYTILLPNSDRHGAQAVCERLQSVFKNKFEDASGNSITFSLHIGVATHPGGEDISRELLLEKAGEALKQSELKGPNTCIYLS